MGWAWLQRKVGKRNWLGVDYESYEADGYPKINLPSFVKLIQTNSLTLLLIQVTRD